MNSEDISVEIHLTPNSGAVKARADVRIDFSGSALAIYGSAVIEKDGKPPWVGLPQKQGKIPGKYFPVVEADGEVREQLSKAILDAYRKAREA